MQGEKELNGMVMAVAAYRDVAQSEELLDQRGSMGFLSTTACWPGCIYVQPAKGNDGDAAAFAKAKMVREAAALAGMAAVYEAEHQRSGTQPSAHELDGQQDWDISSMPELTDLLSKPSSAMAACVPQLLASMETIVLIRLTFRIGCSGL